MGTGGNKEPWVRIVSDFAQKINYALNGYVGEVGAIFGKNLYGTPYCPQLKAFNRGEFLVNIDGKEYIVSIRPKDMK